MCHVAVDLDTPPKGYSQGLSAHCRRRSRRGVLQGRGDSPLKSRIAVGRGGAQGALVGQIGDVFECAVFVVCVVHEAGDTEELKTHEVGTNR